jgi:hypothetical protein
MGGAAGTNNDRGRLLLRMFRLTRSKEGPPFDEMGAAVYPLKDVRLKPTYAFAAKSLFSRKLSDCGHAAKRPRRSPDEPTQLRQRDASGFYISLTDMDYQFFSLVRRLAIR